ncbi:MAG TPA: exodeoxyribonuclease VII large subunit [Candidatus Aquilonibacter sp.]|nr:exodeoxyribonuclease VII large subunit [Candidatus Aquilonibacter sp.]
MSAIPPGVTVRTVSEFTNGLAKWFANQSAFLGAAISGEISGLKETTGGHMTFALKDRGAVLNCIVWQSNVRALPAIANGTAVIAFGTIKLRGDYSAYQMIVDTVQLTGIGELFAKFEALKEQFRAEGLFEPARKRPVPAFVRSVALISAPGSKASEDFLSTMRSKAPFVRIEFLKTRVQGAGAEIDIRDAFDRAERMDVDAIVLTRGGGSYEDLFTFNEETVVRAIVRSRHPVITAIGHQEDHHLADDVADAVYGTPSKAAEAIAQAWVDIRERIGRAKRDLGRAVVNALGTKSQSLALKSATLEGCVRARASRDERAFVALERRLNAQNPTARVQRLRERFMRQQAMLDRFPPRVMQARARADASIARLDPAWARLFARSQHDLQVAATRLDALDPHAPLGRGYAMIVRDGAVVREASQLTPGDTIVARLGHGTVDARVEAVHDE